MRVTRVLEIHSKQDTSRSGKTTRPTLRAVVLVKEMGQCTYTFAAKTSNTERSVIASFIRGSYGEDEFRETYSIVEALV